MTKDVKAFAVGCCLCIIGAILLDLNVLSTGRCFIMLGALILMVGPLLVSINK